ncbi:MAG: DNA methylase [Planctomycetes bacterium]|nr:DNA methylase [Planctomycetota bacterium]
MSEKRLAQLEAVIKKYRQDFYSVGKALKEIRDGRHYHRLSFKSFESYVRLRWDMGRSHAYRLIEAVSVIDNLSPIGEALPQNEAQARPLSKLDAFSQRRLWRDFLETGKTLTALNIKKVVSAQLGEQKTKAPFIEVISRDYQQAVCSMLSQISIAQNDSWKSTSQKTALYWNKVMKEKILWG